MPLAISCVCLITLGLGYSSWARADAMAQRTDEKPCFSALVAGVVIGPDGAPIISGWATLRSLGRILHSLPIDSHGVFVIPNVVEGTYELIVEATGYSEPQVSIFYAECGEVVVLTIQVTIDARPVAVIGQVTDAETANEIGLATVQLKVGDTVIEKAVTAADSYYQVHTPDLKGITTATVEISAGVDYEVQTREITLDPANPVDVSVSLQRLSVGGSVFGMARNQSGGDGMPEVAVDVTDGEIYIREYTDGAGEFVVSDVREGSHLMRASKLGYHCPGQPFVATVSNGGAPPYIDIQMQYVGEGEGENEVNAEALLDVFNDADTDSDGALTFEEAVAALGSLTQAEFDALDENGDGELTVVELESIVAGGEGEGEGEGEGGWSCPFLQGKGLRGLLGDFLILGLTFGAVTITRRARF